MQTGVSLNKLVCVCISGVLAPNLCMNALFTTLCVLVALEMCNAITQHDPPLSGDRTLYYFIDNRPATLADFEGNEYSPQDGDRQFYHSGNCVDYLVLESQKISTETGGNLDSSAVNFYPRNFLPERDTTADWGLDIEIYNLDYRPGIRCSISGSARDVTQLNSGCLVCMEPSQQVVIFVSGSNPLNRWDVSTRKARCTLSKVKDCKPKTCSNGQYVNTAGTLVKGVITNNVECIACTAGTWLTCKDVATCEYTIPTNLNGFSAGNHMYTTGDIPLGKCYPCATANLYSHYEYKDSPNHVLITSGTWKCPGGASPPAMCPANTRVNGDYTQCVCLPGFYAPNGNKPEDCYPCEAGYMCSNGVRQRCPAHMYQLEGGKTSCLPCTTTGFVDGNSMVDCGAGYSMQWCDPTHEGTQNQPLGQLCIPCTQCARRYSKTIAEGALNCYRRD